MTSAPAPMTSEDKPGYGSLLGNSRFEGFLWAQFLGAFNENVYRIIVPLSAARIAVDAATSGRYLALSGIALILPVILFSGYAGQLADRYSKTRVLRITKVMEILTMLIGIAALLANSMNLLLAALFLLKTQVTFFSPAKYGILPEAVGESQLSRANGLLELTTFAAIVAGAAFGSRLFEHWNSQPLNLGLVMLAISIVGTLLCLHIPIVPTAGRAGKFDWNLFGEISAGIKSLKGRRPLGLTMLGISWFWFVGTLVQMALVFEASEILHIAGTPGFLVTALAIGIGLGSLMAGRISGSHIELGLVPLGSIIMGIFSLLLASTTNYNFALIALALVGFGGGFMAVPLNAYLQQEPAADEKGRMIAVSNLMNGVAMIVATFLVDVMYDQFHRSPRTIFAGLGLVMVAGAVVGTRIMPAFVVRFVLAITANLLFRIRIIGGENIPKSGPALIVSNHVSYADAVLAGYATHRIIRFLMWKPIYEVPFAKPFFEVLKAIPIDNGSPKLAIRALRSANEELQNGKLVGIFPEGQITRDGEIAPFERGYERVIRGIDCPIIPVHIDGMWGHPLSRKGGNVFQSWEGWFRPRVTVRIGKPVSAGKTPEELREIVVNTATAM